MRSYPFDPSKHPRDKLGRFGEVGPPPDKADKKAYTKWLRALVRQNYNNGASRKEAIKKKLNELYSKEEGFEIFGQCYLCDNLGRRLKDPEIGKARRIDFIVVYNGKAIRSIEVTSKKAQKTTQMNKEKRIRQTHRKAGKVLYAQITGGDLIKIPYSLRTKVWRTEDFAA